MARSARTCVAELPHRELPTSRFKSNSAIGVNLKARSGALLPTQFKRGRTGRPPLRWLSPAAPLCSSGITTYRLRSPAAAATPQARRAAAAILVRVRRRRTGLSPTPASLCLRRGAEAPRRRERRRRSVEIQQGTGNSAPYWPLAALLRTGPADLSLAIWIQFSQFSRSIVSDCLRPQGLQHAGLSCPSPTPGACSNSCPWSQ